MKVVIGKFIGSVLVLALLLQSVRVVFAQDTQPGEPNPNAAPPAPKNYIPLVRRNHPQNIVIVSNSGFGIEMGYELVNGNPTGPVDMMSKAGANWVRNNALLWSNVESSPGVRNWDPLVDQRMRNAHQYNLEPILIIRSTPTWAQGPSNKSCGAVRPDALDEFAAFMHDVVARYSASPYFVRYYEVWNEPDVDPYLVPSNHEFGCWGDVTDPLYGGGYYADMLKVVYPAMKQANSQAQILVGGLLMYCNPANPYPNSNNCQRTKFIEGVLANGGGNFFDGISFHSYDYFFQPPNQNDPNSALGNYSNYYWYTAWDNNGPSLVDKTKYLLGLLNTYHVTGKYLINSEFGIFCGTSENDTFCNAKYPVTSWSFQNTKAYYTVQSYALSHFLRIRANIWYSFFGFRNSGAYNTSTNKYEAAYNAFSFAKQQIGATTSSRQLSLGSGVRGYEFNSATKKVWIVWYVGGNPTDGTETTTVNLPSTPSSVYRFRNVGSGTASDGTYQSASVNQTITIGRGPVFVIFPP